jgi:predicted dinucleotide-binding enzyme
MRIGILGSGNMGSVLGALFSACGHEVVYSFARTREKLESLARTSGPRARAGTPREAAEGARVVVLAVHWTHAFDVLVDAAPASGTILLDCTNPMNDDDTALAVGHTTSGGEMIASAAPHLRVVKAFNTIPSEMLRAIRTHGVDRLPTRPSGFNCGDDEEAKATVGMLMQGIGLEPLDVGPLSGARWLEPAALLIAQLAYAEDARPEIAFALVRH